MQYDAFDSFINTETWHTQHPLDEERFFRALQKVVNDPGFNADEMAEHMKSKFRDNSQFEEAIDHYRSAAWAVVGYLKATK